jgi:HlyD family secretion protein
VSAKPRRRFLLPAVVVVIGIAGGVAFHRASSEAAVGPSIGVVHETEIHIAPEVSGRLETILVKAGQQVHKGDPLAILSIPELTSAVEEARAAAAKSQADRDNVYSGVRQEEVGRTAQNVEIAESNLVLARQQYARVADLAAKNIESQQQLDQIAASLHAAEANLALLRAIDAENRAGPTKEERASADARVALAKAATASLEARLGKTNLLSPVDGTVRILVAAPGEVLAPGESVMTLAEGTQQWFTFTIREDRLGGVTIGSKVRLQTARREMVGGHITQITPLGEFATWRAARAVGDHDLNSFLVRVDPETADGTLEPGMTVWLDPGAGAEGGQAPMGRSASGQR